MLNTLLGLHLSDVCASFLSGDTAKDEIHFFQRTALRLGDKSVFYSSVRCYESGEATYAEKVPMAAMLIVANIMKIFHCRAVRS
jgi:hypothetical protein